MDRGIDQAARFLGSYGRQAATGVRELAAPVSAAVGEGTAQVEGRLRELDALVFDRLKAGLRLAREHQAAALGAGAALALVCLPGPRHLLWRFAVSRLRSPEGLFKTAVRRQEELAAQKSACGNCYKGAACSCSGRRGRSSWSERGWRARSCGEGRRSSPLRAGSWRPWRAVWGRRRAPCGAWPRTYACCP